MAQHGCRREGFWIARWPVGTTEKMSRSPLPSTYLATGYPLDALPTCRQLTDRDPKAPAARGLLQHILTWQSRYLTGLTTLNSNRRSNATAHPGGKLALKAEPLRPANTAAWHHWLTEEHLALRRLTDQHLTWRLSNNHCPRARRKHQPRKKQDWHQGANEATGQAKAQSPSPKRRAARTSNLPSLPHWTKRTNANKHRAWSTRNRTKRNAHRHRKASSPSPPSKKSSRSETTSANKAKGLRLTKPANNRRSGKAEREEASRHGRKPLGKSRATRASTASGHPKGSREREAARKQERTDRTGRHGSPDIYRRGAAATDGGFGAAHAEREDRPNCLSERPTAPLSCPFAGSANPPRAEAEPVFPQKKSLRPYGQRQPQKTK